MAHGCGYGWAGPRCSHGGIPLFFPFSSSFFFFVLFFLSLYVSLSLSSCLSLSLSALYTCNSVL